MNRATIYLATIAILLAFETVIVPAIGGLNG